MKLYNPQWELFLSIFMFITFLWKRRLAVTNSINFASFHIQFYLLATITHRMAQHFCSFFNIKNNMFFDIKNYINAFVISFVLCIFLLSVIVYGSMVVRWRSFNANFTISTRTFLCIGITFARCQFFLPVKTIKIFVEKMTRRFGRDVKVTPGVSLTSFVSRKTTTSVLFFCSFLSFLCFQLSHFRF